MINSEISAQLALMQLSDSFFPTGSFTFSHGLETLVQTGKIQSKPEILYFLQILLRNKVGVSDVVALIHSYRGCKNGNIEAAKAMRKEVNFLTIFYFYKKGLRDIVINI